MQASYLFWLKWQWKQLISWWDSGHAAKQLLPLTYHAGSVSESISLVHESHPAGTSMFPILLEVRVKMMHWLTRVLVSACSQTATSMLLIMLEVSVKANHWYTRFIARSQRATFMLLILLEVTVKATAQDSQTVDKGLLPFYLCC